MGERFLVTGGNRLSGEVAVGGAKNSVLKLMAASLLAEGTTTITNCPDILDVPLMAEVLRGLGANVELDGSVVRITAPDEPKYEADFAAVRQFRASVCVLGPLVGAATIVSLQTELADSVGSWVTVIMGTIFVVCVLAFRRGIVGELKALRGRGVSGR